MADPRHSSDIGLKRTVLSPLRPIRPIATSITYVLRQMDGPGAPRDIVIHGDQFIIGRSNTCDLIIPSLELSRRHVVLYREGADYVAEDLDSQNGVHLNGVRVHSAVLRGGDTLHVGDVTFLYVEGM